MTNQIKSFYNKVRKDITIAKSKKALRILEKRAIRYYGILEKSMAANELKQDAYRDLIDIKNIIKSKMGVFK